MADHILEVKKELQESKNLNDATRIEVNGLRENSQAVETQLNVIIDGLNEQKKKIKTLESSLTKLYQDTRYLSRQNVVQTSEETERQEEKPK